VLSVFRLRDEVCLNWSAPNVAYAYFRVNCFYDGRAQGLDQDTTISGTDRDLQYWIRLQGCAATTSTSPRSTTTITPSTAGRIAGPSSSKQSWSPIPSRARCKVPSGTSRQKNALGLSGSSGIG